MNPGQMTKGLYARPNGKRCDAHQLRDRASTRLAELMSGDAPRVDTVVEGWLTPERRMASLQEGVEQLSSRIEELEGDGRPAGKLKERRDQLVAQFVSIGLDGYAAEVTL